MYLSAINPEGNHTLAEVKVREATSNDPWGPSTTLMSQIADLTYNLSAFPEIMGMIWKRLNDHGKNWRHVYKSLVLLDYLLKTGSEHVVDACRENVHQVRMLLDFQNIEDGKDRGANIREKAKQITGRLEDDERYKTEREKTRAAQDRYSQNTGIKQARSHGGTHASRRSAVQTDPRRAPVTATNEQAQGQNVSLNYQSRGQQMWLTSYRMQGLPAPNLAGVVRPTSASASHQRLHAPPSSSATWNGSQKSQLHLALTQTLGLRVVPLHQDATQSRQIRGGTRHIK